LADVFYSLSGLFLEGSGKGTTMHLAVYHTATDFLDTTRAALEKNEAANGLALGVALRLAEDGDNAGVYLATVLEDSKPVLGAIMTPPHNMLLFSPEPSSMAAAMPLLCRSLKESGIPVPGVLGAAQVTAQFVREWTHLAPAKAIEGMSQGIYELRKVNPAAIAAPGHFRLAESRDLDLLTTWHGEVQRASLDGLIQAQHIGVWEDRRVVSCAAQARPTTHGVGINHVFTPEEFRRKGYATACVASLCRHLLNAGQQFCYLHTDMANQTSNSIYQNIGFTSVCGFQEYSFSELPNRRA
jgi:GNAT superfamily N-acetyltransferase